MALTISPPMSLTRNADLAPRTVTLFGGAREGETVSFGVLTAVPQVRVICRGATSGPVTQLREPESLHCAKKGTR
jgi:hypothetical protein